MVEYWLEATEQIMDDLDCSVEQNLKGAVSLLRDEAYQWWITVRESTPIERVTWELFKTTFKGSVRFEDGLHDELRVLIAPQRERDFAALVEKVKIAEEVKRTERQNCERHRPRFKRDSGPSGAAYRNACKDYGRVHMGECWKRTRAFFDMGQTNISLESVLREQLRIKLRSKEVSNHCEEDHHHKEAVGKVEVVMGDAPDVITGTFFIHSTSYTTLINVGSTHSYVAYNVSGALGVLFEENVSGASVISPLGHSTKHRAKLDCVVKRMVLRTSEDEEIMAFLAFVSQAEPEGVTVESVRTIKEFQDVFPEELPKLPPNREVEFRIDLLPRTAPMSIAPYPMIKKQQLVDESLVSRFQQAEKGENSDFGLNGDGEFEVNGTLLERV
ncbi:uncharacterized protein LOC128279934 [Gossypium arboreum]|uniref:uncharacterized protein LOC128279934 n=1 Tax=Gossypium arboreum TaxID=29729 RepID=UPI0022F15169|nr:uncharacterized protein LOC128279934 [Gossypium arboreum]